MKKQWMVRQIGSGENIKTMVEAETREDAIEEADKQFHLPWHVRKVTARPAKEDEQDDRTSLEWK